MKTTDGIEVKVGSYYYLENGQSVSLDSCATTPDGNDAFLVTPYYEGETMTVSGDGGSHHEYTAEYEHEGELTLVTSIFEEAPLDKLCDKYKDKLKEIEKLSLTHGELVLSHNNEKSKTFKLTRKTLEAERLYVLAAGKLKSAQEEVDVLEEQINNKRQSLSELEDSIGDMKSEDVSSLVSKTELMRLNKRDFKLQCLEGGGVDNWTFYDDSLDDYRERYPA